MSEDIVKYTLKKPITGDKGEIIAELTFREAEVGDMIAAEKIGGGQQSQTLAILAGMSGIGLPLFKKVKARDLKGIMEACKDFLDIDFEESEVGGTSAS